jgi:hypothetical protein
LDSMIASAISANIYYPACSRFCFSSSNACNSKMI